MTEESGAFTTSFSDLSPGRRFTAKASCILEDGANSQRLYLLPLLGSCMIHLTVVTNTAMGLEKSWSPASVFVILKKVISSEKEEDAKPNSIL